MRQHWTHAGEIALLITDVVMPEMNGRDLAQHLKTHYPALKVLFMSGYPDEGRLDQLDGVEFIRKPFTPNELKTKISTMLKTGLRSR